MSTNLYRINRDKLRRFMLKSNIGTMDELTKAAKVNRANVYKGFSEGVSVATLVKLGKVLNVRAIDLTDEV